MSSSSMTFGRPARLTLPRASSWFASVTALALAGLRRLDRWLLSVREPEPQTPQEVLAWANRLQATEPGFADDLRAAALRAMNDEAR